MNRLRDERFRQKISQFQLSLKSGIWASKISWIENYHWNPTQEEQLKLANALGVEVDWLFAEKNNKQEKERP